MRIIRYSVVDKATKKSVFTHCRMHKAQEFFDSLEHKENYAIGYKWLSI